MEPQIYFVSPTKPSFFLAEYRRKHKVAAVQGGNDLKKNNFSHNRILVRHIGNRLGFWFRTDQGEVFLFAQRPYAGVIHYFRNGITEVQLYNHKWGRDKMVDHVIRKLPKYISYIRRYAA